LDGVVPQRSRSSEASYFEKPRGFFAFTLASTASACFIVATAALIAGRIFLPRYRPAAARRAGLLWRNASNSCSNRLHLRTTRGPSRRFRNVSRATLVLFGTL